MAHSRFSAVALKFKVTGGLLRDEPQRQQHQLQLDNNMIYIVHNISLGCCSSTALTRLRKTNRSTLLMRSPFIWCMVWPQQFPPKNDG